MSDNSKTTKTVTSAIRLDKWLWVARIYKTRSIAKEMIDGGKVHYNGQRTKASKEVEIGALIKVRQGFDEKEFVVEDVMPTRVSAPIAETLYQETAASKAKREKLSEARKLGAIQISTEKPNKKSRRDLAKFKAQQIS